MTTAAVHPDTAPLSPAPVALPSAPGPAARVECDEYEFIACVFALCDWTSYIVALGQILIVGRA